MDKTTKDLISQLNNILEVHNQFDTWVNNSTLSEDIAFKFNSLLNREATTLIKDIIHIERL